MTCKWFSMVFLALKEAVSDDIFSPVVNSGSLQAEEVWWFKESKQTSLFFEHNLQKLRERFEAVCVLVSLSVRLSKFLQRRVITDRTVNKVVMTTRERSTGRSLALALTYPKTCAESSGWLKMTVRKMEDVQPSAWTCGGVIPNLLCQTSAGLLGRGLSSFHDIRKRWKVWKQDCVHKSLF